MSEDEESGWVIELCSGGRPLYWNGQRHDVFDGRSDEAIRFARKKDAEFVLAHIITAPLRDDCVATEHLWIGRPLPEIGSRWVSVRGDEVVVVRRIQDYRVQYDFALPTDDAAAGSCRVPTFHRMYEPETRYASCDRGES